MQPFKLTDLSTYRSEHMGLAMLYIIMFHVTVKQTSWIYGLNQQGNIGVDMFLLLSGIGLWFSWQKDSNTWRFLKKRYLRVYPAYFIMAAIYYLSKYQGGTDIWGDPNNCLTDLVMDILINWDFWLHKELHFWFIPAIMTFYMLTPWYMKAIKKWPSFRWLPGVLICWCLMMWWVIPIHNAVGHLEIFWTRMPIFFIGINIAIYIRDKKEIEPAAFWPLLLSLIFFSWCIYYLEEYQTYHYPLFIERLVYIPMTLSILLLEGKILGHCPQWLHSVLKFIGKISLEMYLVHEVLIFEGFTGLFPDNYWIRIAALIALAIPLSWLLHTAIDKVTKRLI